MASRFFKTIPLTVYLVKGSDQRNMFPFQREQVPHNLTKCRFHSIDDDPRVESCSGLVPCLNYRADNFLRPLIGFSPDPVPCLNYRADNFLEDNGVLGDYVFFSVRRDERKIPSPAFKKHFEDALDAEKVKLKEQGKAFISRERKAELRDQVRLKLRATVVPTPSVVDVFWNMKTGLLFVASKQSKILADLERHFRRAFGPALWLERIHFRSLFPTLTEDDSQGFFDWLWKYQETDNVYQDRKGLFSAYLSGRMEAKDRNGLKVRVEDLDDEFAEIVTALEKGKKITKTGLSLVQGSMAFHLGLSLDILPLDHIVTGVKKWNGDPDEWPGAVMELAGQIEEAFRLLVVLLLIWVQETRPEVVQMYQKNSFSSYSGIHLCELKFFRDAMLSLQGTEKRQV